ncbi:MAG: tRNA (N6-isopentenyl adenosine(37)-C2)-methylthiotransferase MiaB [Deltaproteobacteria bacterium]|nr:MAG: tRNA (N6-isopentenyl adenosine(37)-C2)-methylthiotransferase MiaB [Deltaproteobacteria bacterium]
MTLSFYLKTFGCQMNKHDSDSISQILLNQGYRQSQAIEDAQIILINTCAVRQKAEDKALTLIGRLAPLKRKNPDLITGVLGCVAQNQGVDLLAHFPHLDLVIGPRNVHHIDELISKIRKQRNKVFSLDLTEGISLFPKYNGYLKGKVTSFLKIMEGCDNFCSFCIVPFVRGRETSVPATKIIDRAHQLIREGVREITLIGQNVNSYNEKSKAEPSFAGLLKALDEIPGLQRLRFTTSHPKDLSDELIGLFGRLKTLCPHIHLPVQSGSNAVLRSMNRGYTEEQYRKLIEKLRRTRPDIAVSSDMIVGFPGETEKDFQDSLSLIEEVEFDNLFSFRYSDRRGTKATRLPNKVAEGEKQERLSLLQERQRKITLAKNKSLEGTTQTVLEEGPAKHGGEHRSGRTPGNKILNYVSTTDLTGASVRVKVLKGLQNSLFGEFVGIARADAQ